MTKERKKTKKRSQLFTIWFRYKKNKQAIFGLILFCVMTLTAVFSSVIVDYENDVITQDMKNRLVPPNAEHIFGTDQYGRDLFARVIWGTRISLYVGLLVIVIALSLGAMIGATAGYFGGKIDNVLMRIMDIFLAIPAMLFAIAIVATLGPGIVNIIIAMGIARTPQFSRIVRSAVLSIREQEFIEAAKACGTKNSRIILKHILPNAIGPIIVQTTQNMATAILGVAALSFIGVGIQPPTPEWGSMLSESRDQMRFYPYLMIPPGFAIMLAVLSLNLIGDGLRDALDPRLKN